MSTEARSSLNDEDIERIVTAAAKAFEAGTGISPDQHAEQHRYLMEEMEVKRKRRERADKILTHVTGTLVVTSVVAVYKYVIEPLVGPIGEVIMRLFGKH